MSNLLSANLQYITISIEDDNNKLGTGFLVGDTVTERDGNRRAIPTWTKPRSRAYLVTARHVLGDNASVISSTLAFVLRYNVLTSAGLSTGTSRFIVNNDEPNWMIHEDSAIDVGVLDVTNWLRTASDGHFRFVPLSELASPLSLASVECDAGDDVFVLGYPLRLKQGDSNLPLVRKGVLATSPQRRLLDENGNDLRGFLVDGAIMPGSSGSPVVSTSKRFIAGDLELTSGRSLILGVVRQEWGRGEKQRYDAATKGVSIDDAQIGSYANLGFAHGSSTIIETILRFGHLDAKEFLWLDHEYWAPQLGIPEWALEYDGPRADRTATHRIFLRLWRDNLRAQGKSVAKQAYHDAEDIMGPVA
jgi:hypothetical protein